MIAPLVRAASTLGRFVPVSERIRPTIEGNTLDRSIAVGLWLHGLSGATRLDAGSAADARREHGKQLGAFGLRGPRSVHTRDTPLAEDGDGVWGRLYTPGETDRVGALVVWFHGGGWVIGSVEGDDRLCRWLAAHLGCRVLSVEYRLGPEHRFPAAHDDAATAWAAAVDRADEFGADRARMAVAGSSAGANLAAYACIAARDRGLPRPAHQLLFYPGTDMRCCAGSHTTFAEGFILDSRLIVWFLDNYVPPESRTDPRVSVLLADELSHLPPAQVITAGFDPLRDEGDAYARRLAESGVPVRHECAGSLTHAFLDLAGAIPACRDIVVRAFDELGAAIGATPRRTS